MCYASCVSTRDAVVSNTDLVAALVEFQVGVEEGGGLKSTKVPLLSQHLKLESYSQYIGCSSKSFCIVRNTNFMPVKIPYFSILFPYVIMVAIPQERWSFFKMENFNNQLVTLHLSRDQSSNTAVLDVFFVSS